jgi:glycosyltransferase involved in cell wall biosynthesis
VWPPDFSPAGDSLLVEIIHWEYGAIPKDWVEPITRHVNEVWVLSQAVREAFVQSGIDPARLVVIGGGVDPQIFRPGVPPMDLPTQKGFRFLYVGAPLRRKGIDLLLRAYREEFHRDEDVALVVKDVSYYANGMRKVLHEAARDPDGAEIVVLDGDLPAGGMPALYAACDAVVQPYRAEGLCLPLLEAMACEIPVAGTALGASLDYLNPSNGYPLPADQIEFPACRVDGIETAGRPFWAEPRLADLKRTLREMAEDHQAAMTRARQARHDVGRRWTWQQAASVARNRLDALFGERDRRYQALELFVEGTTALEEERPRDALAALEAALSIEPCFPMALSEYGVALVQLGELESAHKVLEQAARLDPESEEVRNNLAVVTALIAELGIESSAGMEFGEGFAAGEERAA